MLERSALAVEIFQRTTHEYLEANTNIVRVDRAFLQALSGKSPDLDIAYM